MSILLISSFIDTQVRCDRFIECLELFSKQTQKTDRFIISICFKHDVDLTKLLKHLNNNSIEIVLHSKQMLQFEHIHYIFDKYLVDIPEETRIIFFDDDDLPDLNIIKELLSYDEDFVISNYKTIYHEYATSLDNLRLGGEFGGTNINYKTYKLYKQIQNENCYLITGIHDCLFKVILDKLFKEKKITRAFAINAKYDYIPALARRYYAY